MLKRTQKLSLMLALGLTAASLGLRAHAAEAADPATVAVHAASAATAATAATAIYGQPAAGAAADKQVALRPDTRWVNVNNGDTVRFSAGGKSFVWHFDTLQDSPTFALGAIAPRDVDVGAVRVYVAANPLYRN